MVYRTKRGIGLVAGLLVAAYASAQAPFTIVRPADGSKVRETVNILMPKDSIPEGGYIGVFLNGRFIEGTLPPVSGKYYSYALDTKNRKIPDGIQNVEVVLYQDVNGQPRVVDRSSIEINVQNSASIQVPAEGIALRYRFVPDRTYFYRVDNKVTMSSISEEQNRLGGRAAEQDVESQVFRMMYAVDNVFPGGDGLVRMAAQPLKGKKTVFLSTTMNPDGRFYDESEMAPIYMRLTNTGRQVWGNVPAYWPIEGGGGIGSTTNLFANFPLPTLPPKRVKPGDVWAGRFQLGQFDMNQLYTTNSLVQTFPARGEFLGVEWERGFPCARIRQSVELGAKSVEGEKLKKEGRDFTDEKVQVTENYWFSLDSGLLVRLDREISMDMVSTQPSSGVGVPGAGQGMGGSFGPPAGFGGRGVSGPPAGLGIPTGRPGAGGRGGGGRADDLGQDSRRGGMQGGVGGLQGAPPGVGGPGGPPPGFGGPPGGIPGFGRGAARTGGTTATNTFNRIKIRQTFLLER
ncbi:MAG: hypothetical protein KIS66_03080 [Fimbriimonadaceae bacterium]|nr:hypothetical protein [Fimbriimonadaceae bacterium]